MADHAEGNNEVPGGARPAPPDTGEASATSPPPDEQAIARQQGAPASRLDVALIGKLPCIICGYELQGLSVRGTCPECGTLVRATILHRVDPEAEEFVPLYSAKAVALGLVFWIGGAMIVAMAGWARRVGEWADALWLAHDPRPWLGFVALGGVIISAVGALAIVKPTRETKPWKAAAAMVGVLAYVPMLWAVQRLARLDAVSPADLFSTSTMPEREVARLVLSGSIIVACLGLRSVARDMARRSLALRTGRVDRQTLLAIAVAAAAGGFGDLIRLWAALEEHRLSQTALLTCNTIGGSIVAVAAVFVTLGVAGAMADSLRVARAIWKPGPTMRQLVGHQA